MFKPEEIPWEIWTIKIEQMQLSSENGSSIDVRHKSRESRIVFLVQNVYL